MNEYRFDVTSSGKKGPSKEKLAAAQKLHTAIISRRIFLSRDILHRENVLLDLPSSPRMLEHSELRVCLLQSPLLSGLEAWPVETAGSWCSVVSTGW